MADQAGLISGLLSLYQIVIIVRVVLSWVDADQRHPAVDFIYSITDPVLKPIREIVPTFAGLDLSPVVVLVALQLLRALF